jgi:nitroreductase
LVLEVIKGRRSVRSFKPDPIPEEHLKLILEVGLWAPSGGNAQPWEFVLVREKQVIDKIRLFSPGLFGDPYALIVLCVNKNRIKRRDESGKQIALMDVAMAAQNMMLEACYLGVGVQLSVVIASFLFPCIPLGFSSGLGAFGATPKTPHLEYHSHPLRESLRRLSTPHREFHQNV